MIRASSFGASPPDSDETNQLAFKDPPQMVRRMKQFKLAAQDKLSVRNAMNIVELIADLPGQGGNASVFPTAEKFVF